MHRKITIPSHIDNLRIIEKIIDEISSESGIKGENYGKILVTTMEAVNNAIVHGNKSDVRKDVEINIQLSGKKLEISVEDQGNGFDPRQIPDPTSPENIQNISGRGVFLMSRLADEIEFNEKGNRVTIRFKEV